MTTTYQRGGKRLSKVKPLHSNYHLYVVEEKNLDALGNPAWTTSKSISEKPEGINEERVVLWLAKQLIDLTMRYEEAKELIASALEADYFEDKPELNILHRRLRGVAEDGSTI